MQRRSDRRCTIRSSASTGLPFVVYTLAMGVFLMGTTEFVVAGLLPGIAADIGTSVAQTGLLITVFAVGMMFTPVTALATRRVPQRLTLILALAVYALGHVIVAVGSNVGTLLAARFVTALATGAFWAVAAVVATRAVGPNTSSRAVGIVNAGGMLATVLGVPLGALAGQLIGWRATFWALAILAVTAMALIARRVPRGGADGKTVSVRSELTALRAGRLWLALAACAATTGGVLAAYSFIAPLLTERAGLSPGLVPLVLAGFGVGSFVGSILGGRLGDTHPHATTIIAPTVTTIILLAMCLTASAALSLTILVVALGFFGLGANPVLITLAVRFARQAPTLGSALAVAAFNTGTAVGSWLGGKAMESSLGALGPVVIGAVIVACTLIPATALLTHTERKSENEHHTAEVGHRSRDGRPPRRRRLRRSRTVLQLNRIGDRGGAEAGARRSVRRRRQLLHQRSGGR